jgi:hypothetical protein
MKPWDAFISYASEDKELVRELTQALRAAGLRIWLDDQELRLGDSLREKIDEGLAASRFGIVVLSPRFIAKRWPRQELNGLMAREESGRKVILPVWHELDKATVAAYSPMIADRLASTTDRGVAAVATDIVRVIVSLERGLDGPTTLGRRFISLLEDEPEAAVIRDFLAAHPQIPAQTVGISPQALTRVVRSGREAVRSETRLGGYELDLCLGLESGTTLTVRWTVVQLETPSHGPFDGGSKLVPSVAKSVAELKALRQWVSRHRRKSNQQLPGISLGFDGIVVAGRRHQIPPDDAERIRRFNENQSITLRTYDWLVDTAVSIS